MNSRVEPTGLEAGSARLGASMSAMGGKRTCRVEPECSPLCAAGSQSLPKRVLSKEVPHHGGDGFVTA